MEQPDGSQPAGEHGSAPLPRSALVPGWALAGLLALIWALHIPQGMVMIDWGISAAILREGHWENVPLHMLAHAGPMHLLFNCSAILAFTPAVIQRLGGSPDGIVRFAALFVLSGLAGLVLFLAIHPFGTVPMLGASGAIYGLIGFLVRYPGADRHESMPLFSRATGKAMVDFLKDNAIMFALLTLPALLSGSSGGVAWESHLGGFLFGLLAASWFAPHLDPPTQEAKG